jgi:hypothetical protein
VKKEEQTGMLHIEVTYEAVVINTKYKEEEILLKTMKAINQI